MTTIPTAAKKQKTIRKLIEADNKENNRKNLTQTLSLNNNGYELHIRAKDGKYTIQQGDPEYNGIYINFRPWYEKHAVPIATIENSDNEHNETKNEEIVIYVYEDPKDEEYRYKGTIQLSKILDKAKQNE